MAKLSPTRFTISTEFEVYKSSSDLEQQDLELLQAAQKAVESAYAPYSHFYVGAAVLLDNGKIIIGNNQENAAYPNGLCAERVAIYHAGAIYPNITVKAIAVTCKSKNNIINVPLSPCGGCRQTISEYENRYEQKIRIIMSGETGEVYISESIESLLPLMFNAKYLPKKD
jgi:cytidine deaminase